MYIGRMIFRDEDKFCELIALANNANGARQLVLNKWNSYERSKKQTNPNHKPVIYANYDQLDAVHPILIAETDLNKCVMI